MDYINCIDKITKKIILSTLNFWSINSYQHIDVIINGHGGTGAILYPQFVKELKTLSNTFKSIEKSSNPDKIFNGDLIALTKKYITTNNNFIKILERLRFEGFNGYPVLYQTVYHFLYEQLYTNKLLEPIHSMPKAEPITSIYKLNFQQSLHNAITIKCIYTQMYFWSLIIGQHPSIIITIPGASKELPNSVKESFVDITTKFNKINFDLSNIYNNLSKQELYKIYRDFMISNDEFLDILNDIKEKNPPLPELFYGTLNHVIDEQMYVDSLLYDFKSFFAK